MPEAALDNWQPVWNAQVSLSTPVCVNAELRLGADDIHICWFNFDVLVQGNAYKPTETDGLSWTRRGSNSWSPGWSNTASCQLSSTFASCHRNCVKNTIPMTCPGLNCTTDDPSRMHRCQFQHPYVNCALRPDAGDIKSRVTYRCLFL